MIVKAYPEKYVLLTNLHHRVGRTGRRLALFRDWVRGMPDVKMFMVPVPVKGWEWQLVDWAVSQEDAKKIIEEANAV